MSGYAAQRLKDASTAIERQNYPLAVDIIWETTRRLGSQEQAARALSLLEALSGHVDTASARFCDAEAKARDALERFALAHQSELVAERLVRLVRLLLADVGLEVTIDLGPVLPLFAQVEPTSELVPSEELHRRMGAWRDQLVQASVSGEKSFDLVSVNTLRDYQRRMIRSLKALAVDLLSRGANVTGLSNDIVPLVAYALLQGHLPAGDTHDPDQTQEQTNDALLRHSDWISSLDLADRYVFIALFRLAFALGVAAAYAKALDLTTLSID